MKRLKMFISGVVALALLCFFSVPMVQAQVLANTTHEVKLSASAVSVLPGPSGFVIERTGGKVAGPVVLRSTGANVVTGGFDYEINLLFDTGSGNTCDETNNIGTLSTYNLDENVALGVLSIVDLDVPEPGLDLFGSFFAQVKTNPQKPGKSSFKSVAGWAEVVVHGAPGPDPDGMTKNFKVQGKEKTLQQLGLLCDLAVAP